MSEKKKILICDDEVGIRESLNLILSETYDLTFCANGQECLQKIAQDQLFDILLLDIKMPGESGFDTLKKIKKQKPQQKVIIITGYKSESTAQEAIKAGALDYIVKPFESKEIIASVTRNTA